MNIYEKQMVEGRLMAKTIYFKNKAEKARRDLRYALAQGPCYLALSWGKQSTILAHMIYGIAPETQCVFRRNPLSDLINNFNELRDTFLAKWPLNYIELGGDADLWAEGKKYNPAELDSLADHDMKKKGREWLIENGLKIVIMGLAAEESNGRRMTLAKANSYNYFTYADGTGRSCPLRFWSMYDLAAYIAANDILMLDTYKRFGLQTRTAAGIRPGGHAEAGIDLLSDEKQKKVREYYAF